MADNLANDTSKVTLQATLAESLRSPSNGAPKKKQTCSDLVNNAKSTAHQSEIILPATSLQKSVQLSLKASELTEEPVSIAILRKENANEDISGSEQFMCLETPQFESKSIRDYENDGGESTAYNRKEKSLGELCRRFLFLYGTPQRGLLYLDQCTKELGVERRRIYDIINILESFSVIQRCAKNEYQWRGIDKIVFSIEKQINACVSIYSQCPPIILAIFCPFLSDFRQDLVSKKLHLQPRLSYFVTLWLAFVHNRKNWRIYSKLGCGYSADSD